MNDEAPLITADDNEELKARNDKKKETLKAAKARLAERHADVRNFAPLVEEGQSILLPQYKALRNAHMIVYEISDYNRARTLTAEATNLTQAILDARLKLTRIKQAHPPPRLTITTADKVLEEQEEEMQKLDDELAAANDRVASVKEGVKEGTREVERLRAERAEAEREVRAGRREGNDGRVVGRHDWSVLRFLPSLVYRITVGKHRIGSEHSLFSRINSQTFTPSLPYRRTRFVSHTISRRLPPPIVHEKSRSHSYSSPIPVNSPKHALRAFRLRQKAEVKAKKNVQRRLQLIYRRTIVRDWWEHC